MKKTTLVITLAIISIFLLVGCTTYSYESTEIETNVIKCEKGIFLPDEEYLAMANVCLAYKKAEMYEYYKKLANEHGNYTYNITISIDGTEYVIVRPEEYEVGSVITVVAKSRYANNKVVYVEYE